MRQRASYVIVTCLVAQFLPVPVPIPVCAENIAVAGDVYIEGMFSTYKADNGQCGAVDPFSVQLQEAAKWTLEQLNTKQFKVTDDTYIPGMKIGLRVHDTCRSPDRAKQIAFNISKHMDDQYSDSVAILGPEFSSEAEPMSRLFSSLPDASKLLQIGYSTTATSLSDHSKYSNFFRTIPPDKIQIQVMRQFMRTLVWTYVAIIYDDDIYGTEAVTQLLDQSETPITCFPVVMPVKTSLAESEAKQFLHKELRDLYNRTIKVGGIIIFGSRNLGYYVLDTVYNITEDNTGYKLPVILGSEGIDFIKGTNTYLSEITKGMFISTPSRQLIEQFRVHWISVMTDISRVKTDHLLSAVYEYLTGCNPSQSEDCNNITSEDIEAKLPQSFMVQYEVQAVLVIAKVINSIHSTICSNTGVICTKLIKEPKNSFIKAINNMTVRFDDHFHPMRIQEFNDLDLNIKFPAGSADATVLNDVSSYSILNRRSCLADATQFCFEKVLDYSEQSDTYEVNLNIIRDYNHDTHEETQYPFIRKPQCPPGNVCVECSSPASTGVEVTEGDMYIVGIAPVHLHSDTPVTCGGIKRGGFDVAESIKFEVHEAMRNIKDAIPEANIGSIIIDSCWDPQIVLERVLNIQKQGVLLHGKYVDVKHKILGFVGAWMSDISIKVAELLSRLRYVQIAYGSTSPLLSNRELYPYFMRVVYSDVEQAKEMLKTVQKIGVNFTQILYAENAYGRGGKDTLVEFARSYNICVANIIGVHEPEQNWDAIKSELSKENAPKVVMTFLSSSMVENALPMLDELKGYLVVGSEGWGTRDILQSVTNLNGSITLANELPINDNFKAHFKSLSPATSLWLQEYIEFYFDCYFEWSFTKPPGKRQCGQDDVFNPSPGVEGSYKLETWVPFAATAVKALLMGARKTLEEVCHTSTSICQEYYYHPETLIKNIRLSKIEYDGISPKNVFGPNNDGIISYNKYQITIRNGVAAYEPLPLSWTWPHSVCSHGNDACDVCFPPPATPVPTVEDGSQLGLVVSLAVFVVLTAGLLIVIAMCACSYRRRCLCFKYDDHGNTYLTTIYDKGHSNTGYRGRENEAPPTNLYDKAPTNGFSAPLDELPPDQLESRSAENELYHELDDEV